MVAKENAHSPPLVSIGIPCHNRPAGLERAIESALAQTFPDLEVLVSDNASTDETGEVGRRFARKDKRVRYFRQETNVGPTKNFRFVRDNARGRFFMWLADDDWLESDIIAACVEFLTQNPDYAMASGDIVYWEDGREVYREFNLTFDNPDPSRRVAQYFRKVFVGGLFHSLIRSSLARQVPVHNVIGADWFLVSNLLFLGKNKNLRRDGYHKACQGISVSHDRYARVIGASNFTAHNPYLTTAVRVFGDVLRQADVYRTLPPHKRLALALNCSWSIIRNFYVKRFVREPLSFTKETASSLFHGLLPRRILPDRSAGAGEPGIHDEPT